jgi:transposase-like protein
MAKHRTHSIEFKRQVVQEFLGGESPHALAKRHGISRNLIKIWVAKYDAGGLDSDAAAADVLVCFSIRPKVRAPPVPRSTPRRGATRLSHARRTSEIRVTADKSSSRWLLVANYLPRLTAGMVRPSPRKRRMVSMNLATEIGFDR